MQSPVNIYPMIKVFIDTDVIIDFLADRKPFSESAAILFNRIEKKEIEGFTSSQSISNLYDILRKYDSQRNVIQALSDLISLIGILPVGHEVIQKALQSDFTDFEDGIQNFCAETEKMDVIVTRNIRDYKRASIAVLNPDLI
jgi:predicted nucleic acid-binding protein